MSVNKETDTFIYDILHSYERSGYTKVLKYQLPAVCQFCISYVSVNYHLCIMYQLCIIDVDRFR